MMTPFGCGEEGCPERKPKVAKTLQKVQEKFSSEKILERMRKRRRPLSPEVRKAVREFVKKMKE